MTEPKKRHPRRTKSAPKWPPMLPPLSNEQLTRDFGNVRYRPLYSPRSFRVGEADEIPAILQRRERVFAAAPGETNAVPGDDYAGDYAELRRVLDLALRAASTGKGRARHADGNPFPEQPMLAIARMVGVGFPLGQAMKKCQEAARFAAPGPCSPVGLAKAEILDAIVYLAGAHIALDRRGKIEATPGVPANPKNELTFKLAVDTKKLRKIMANAYRETKQAILQRPPGRRHGKKRHGARSKKQGRRS